MSSNTIASLLCKAGMSPACAALMLDLLGSESIEDIEKALNGMAECQEQAPSKVLPTPGPSPFVPDRTLTEGSVTPRTPVPSAPQAPTASPLPTRETCSDPAAGALAARKVLATQGEAKPVKAEPMGTGEAKVASSAAKRVKRAAEQTKADREAKAAQITKDREERAAKRQADREAKAANKPRPVQFTNVLPDGRIVVTTVSPRGKVSARFVESLADAA